MEHPPDHRRRTNPLRGRLVLHGALHHAPAQAWDLPFRLHLEKKAGESMAHVVMKALSWWVCARPGLQIEAPADPHYRPDLVDFDADGRPCLWVDCGMTSVHKLEHLVRTRRSAHVVIVKRTPRDIARYRRGADRHLVRPAAVTWLSFSHGFVDALAQALWGQHRAIATLAEGDPCRLWLEVDGQLWETDVHVDGHPPWDLPTPAPR